MMISDFQITFKNYVNNITNEISIVKENVDGKVKASVTITKDGKEAVSNFEGTDEEVQAQIDALK
jgi:K(+)-stimulated pyrophosphate-energized sodium pump